MACCKLSCLRHLKEQIKFHLTCFLPVINIVEEIFQLKIFHLKYSFVIIFHDCFEKKLKCRYNIQSPYILLTF